MGDEQQSQVDVTPPTILSQLAAGRRGALTIHRVVQEIAPAATVAPRGLNRTAMVIRVIRRLQILPPASALGPVVYTPAVLAYVSLVAASAAVLSALLVRLPTDTVTLAVGGVATLLMARFAVRTLPVQTAWSAGVFLHLGLSVVLGPIGAVTAAAAEAIGVGLRTRNGWFRITFNLANYVLADLAAWAVFTAVTAAGGSSVYVQVGGGLAAGLCQYLVNHALIAAVLKVSDPTMSLVALVRSQLTLLPYSVGYGLAAFTFVAMHSAAGAIGFTALLLPMILLQGFLIVFARRVQAYEAQRAAHQKEREELLQKAVDASESERRRIARDLHDGVVQNLAGMAFSLMATATKMKHETSTDGESELIGVLERSAEETRLAMKELRTLIIEIAPPTLRREGLHAALLEILQTLKSAGTKTRLELPSNMRLRPDRASLIFRVAQEVLRNVSAHAEAKHVSVVLKEDGGNAVLSIVDDGKGFSADDVARRRAEGHVGTSAIVELAEEVGGSLEIDSARGKGTRVTLVVPTE
jgi:signal transduction histidine kinase